LKQKVFSLEEVLDKIKDGQRIMFSDRHGELAADEIIDGMIKKGVKDITAVAITSGQPGMGLGRLVEENRVRRIETSHIGLNPTAINQMFSGKLDVEFIPQGTFAERIRAGGFGLGGVLTPTGIGTMVQEGKQILFLNGREYLLEMPIRADVALLRASKADKAGNLYFRQTNHLCQDYMAMAADLVIAEVEELVEIGELNQELIHVSAPVVDMLYVRKGEKRPMHPNWQRMIDKIKAREAAEA